MSLSVGERLKSAREAKNISLQEACSFTKIQRQTLEAIEENRVHEAMDPVYARIFIKKYAVFLGLDGPAMVSDYASQIGQAIEPEPARSQAQAHAAAAAVQAPAKPAAPAPQVRAAPPPMNKPASFQPPPPEPPSPSDARQLSPLLVPAGVTLAALVGIGFLGYMAIDLYHNIQQNRPPAEERAVSGDNAEKPAPPKLLVPLGKPLRLTVQTSADVWIQMKADGTVVFQNVLKKGSRETWTAKNDLEIWTGNAGAMQLVLNGKPLDGLGRGVRKGVRVTRSGIKD